MSALFDPTRRLRLVSDRDVVAGGEASTGGRPPEFAELTREA